MRKYIPVKMISKLANDLTVNNSPNDLLNSTINRVSQMLKEDVEKISVFGDLLRTIETIIDAYNLNNRKFYISPTFNNNLLYLMKKYNGKMFDLKELYLLNEKSLQIEENSVLIIGSYFSKSVEITQEFYNQLRKKNIFIILVIEESDFYDKKRYPYDIVIHSFDNRCLLFTENLQLVIANNQQIDLFPFANGGYARDGERLFIYSENLPTVSSLSMFNQSLEFAEENYRFMNVVMNIAISKLTNIENKLPVSHYILFSGIHKNDKLSSGDLFKFYPKISFPPTFKKIFSGMQILNLNFNINYKELEDLLEEINNENLQVSVTN